MKDSKTAPPHRHHGRAQYWIEGEGYCDVKLNFSYMKGGTPTMLAPPGGDTMPPVPPPERAFRFCRMFNLTKFEPGDEGLIALGMAMEDADNDVGSDTSIPAGFTYLGQFIDHDTTMDQTEGIPDGSLNPDEIMQGRSPSLDLDSVYGGGPTDSPELFEADGKHLKLGATTGRPIFMVTNSLPNDLPRNPVDDPAKPKQAIIGDPRNDENLVVAQTHVAMLKFHNKVLDIDGGDFDATRKTVVQHYQSIVWHDFVPRLADPAVYQDVQQNGRQFFMPDGIPEGEYPCMPVEFSVAAYRLGHSMVRNSYEWNRIFSGPGPGPSASLMLLFEFSEVSGDLGGSATLPTDWTVDWTRFYDFTGIDGISNHPDSNFARHIDTRLATKLADLPEFAGASQPHLRSLAARNLLRGRLTGLPTGQDIANAIGVTPLTTAELTSGPDSGVLQAHGFDQQTPLWYYVLKE